MSKAISTKHNTGSSRGGLVKNPDGAGYAVDWTELPASDHFFLATHCEIKRDPYTVKILFGSASEFDEEIDSKRHFDLAVEIHFPIKEAMLFLYNGIFKELSGNGKSTFYASLKEANNKWATYSAPTNEKKYRLPENRATAFRKFPANFAAWSYAGTQGLLELFEVPPELIHLLLKTNKIRPRGGVKPVLSIIMDAHTMLSFMDKCRVAFDDNETFGELYGAK